MVCITQYTPEDGSPSGDDPFIVKMRTTAIDTATTPRQTANMIFVVFGNLDIDVSPLLLCSKHITGIDQHHLSFFIDAQTELVTAEHASAFFEVFVEPGLVLNGSLLAVPIGIPDDLAALFHL